MLKSLKMESETTNTTTVGHRHAVAIPYPGRGHINPMLNLCSLILSSQPDLLITVVVTQEWLEILTSDQNHSSAATNLKWVALPQVIPSEVGRADDYEGFIEAVNTKLQEPFESLIERLQPPATTIIYDISLPWVVGVGNRRSIPVAAFCAMSATVFAIVANFQLLVQHGHFPFHVQESGKEKVDYIPGLPSTTLADLPPYFRGNYTKVLNRILERISVINKAQYLILPSIYELENQVVDALKSKLSIPIYTIGPMIPLLNPQSSTTQHYFKWLDSQPQDSVLYISFGSFLSVSSDQMDEIAFGVKQSGVKLLWATQNNSTRLKDIVGDTGLVVSWCDQLRVLCHPSVGGFLTHCGWNSICESIYAGVPMLTCPPIFTDQVSNSKLIVRDWRVGLRVINNDDKSLVMRSEIGEVVKNFMNANGSARKEMMSRVQKLQETLRKAIVGEGSAASNLINFITNIS